MNKLISKAWLLSLAGMLIWFAFCLYGGERIPVSKGLGYDGVIYAMWAQIDPLQLLNSKTIGLYHATRVLPSIMVHYLAQLFHYPLGDFDHPEGVINAFVLLNSALIMGSTFLLYLVAKHLNWSPQVLVLGLAAMFINFPVLKLSSYYPTLTDVPAFFFGLLTFYVYLQGWRLALFAVSLLASFVWPTMLYAALPLLVFPAQNLKPSTFSPANLSHAVSALIGVVLVAGTIYVYYIIGKRIPFGATPVNESVILIGAAMFFAYVFWMLRPFVDMAFFRSTLLSGINKGGVVFAVILVIFVKLAIASFSSQILDGPSFLEYLQNLGLYIIAEPLLNVVAHVSYFGPVMVLLLLLWEEVVALAKQYGPGLLAVLALAVLVSIGTESRTLMAAWPVLAILTCEVLNRRGVSWSLAYAILAIGLITSRFWLPINSYGPWLGTFQDFPAQMFFMNLGPWMSAAMYVVWLIVTLSLFIALSIALKKMSGRENATAAN
ncbi:MAG: hypothetical protein HY016_12645 [Nitrosomonadales bacterium]|nr:hypothetical protein [Nitrosomonadales bacterium]